VILKFRAEQDSNKAAYFETSTNTSVVCMRQHSADLCLERGDGEILDTSFLHGAENRVFKLMTFSCNSDYKIVVGAENINSVRK
jgi:hypothetical protein